MQTTLEPSQQNTFSLENATKYRYCDNEKRISGGQEEEAGATSRLAARYLCETRQEWDRDARREGLDARLPGPARDDRRGGHARTAHLVWCGRQSAHALPAAGRRLLPARWNAGADAAAATSVFVRLGGCRKDFQHLLGTIFTKITLVVLERCLPTHVVMSVLNDVYRKWSIIWQRSNMFVHQKPIFYTRGNFLFQIKRTSKQKQKHTG